MYVTQQQAGIPIQLPLFLHPCYYHYLNYYCCCHRCCCYYY
jgi:hypothetical protein